MSHITLFARFARAVPALIMASALAGSVALAAKAVFAKYLPDLVSNPQLDQGRSMTLPEIVQYVPDLTPNKLAAMDADLKALPPE